MSQASSLWRDLSSESHLQPGWHTRRIFPEAVSDIRVAIREPGGTPAFLFEFPSPMVPSSASYPSSKGFELYPEIAVPGPNGRVRLCLVLTDHVYLDVFEVLCQDVAEGVGRALSEATAFQSLISRLRIWQNFMRRYGPEGLSAEEQTGLFAELHFLKERVFGQVPVLSAAQSWKGPAGGVQDFELPGGCVEVKSTTMLPPATIKISSLSQLDETRVKRLLLCHMVIDTSNVEGLTLPELIQQVRTTTGSEDQSAVIVLNDSLIEAGYLDAHEGLYAGRRYLIREVRYFDVAGDFPRIRATDVRRGVISGSYNVEFSACLPYEVDALRARGLMFGW